MSLIQRRMMMAMGMEDEEMKVYSGTFVGDGTGDAYIDVYEEPDIISIVRCDADNISNGLTRGVFGLSITRDMYYSESMISSDGVNSIANGSVGKAKGLYANANVYAEMTDKGLHVHAIQASRPFADGTTYEYVCVKYI